MPAWEVFFVSFVERDQAEMRDEVLDQGVRKRSKGGNLLLVVDEVIPAVKVSVIDEQSTNIFPAGWKLKGRRSGGIAVLA